MDNPKLNKMIHPKKSYYCRRLHEISLEISDEIVKELGQQKEDALFEKDVALFALKMSKQAILLAKKNPTDIEIIMEANSEFLETVYEFFTNANEKERRIRRLQFAGIGNTICMN